MLHNVRLTSELLEAVMAVFYAVEFPSEDSKSRGPYTISENKVRVKNGKTYVLWCVVDKNGDTNEQYFEATNLKKGSKKECGGFIDHLKKSREKADISNKDGRIRKKPAKLDDYEDPNSITPQTTKPPSKRPRKALFQVQFDQEKTIHDMKVSSEEAGDDDEDLEEDFGGRNDTRCTHTLET